MRAQKLEEAAWNGTVDVMVDGKEGKEEGESGVEGNNLSPEEEEYVRLFGDLLSSVKGVWTDVDLTGSLEPPRDLFVDVRVLRDAGEIQTEYGYVLRLHLGSRSQGKVLMVADRLISRRIASFM